MQTRHFLQLMGLSALWGASFLFIRISSPVFGPQVLAGLRVGLATLALMALMKGLRQRWPWAYWREMFLLGALSVAVPFLFYAWAVNRPGFRGGRLV